ncbi:hypothetical protein [Peribacillus frigoritolerans]|uniref:Uncharacterized protein n=1 Tax=Peribacillus castrilensis TaxID=2897690 RepID=A0AAW9NIG6_9BACI|nr:hypothetical protein [Peribacillus castrilensis]
MNIFILGIYAIILNRKIGEINIELGRLHGTYWYTILFDSNSIIAWFLISLIKTQKVRNTLLRDISLKLDKYKIDKKEEGYNTLSFSFFISSFLHHLYSYGNFGIE